MRWIYSSCTCYCKQLYFIPEYGYYVSLEFCVFITFIIIISDHYSLKHILTYLEMNHWNQLRTDILRPFILFCDWWFGRCTWSGVDTWHQIRSLRQWITDICFKVFASWSSPVVGLGASQYPPPESRIKQNSKQLSYPNLTRSLGCVVVHFVHG